MSLACKSPDVTDTPWRPLGVDTDDDVARYDALYDGVPEWLATPLWTWVRDTVTVIRTYRDHSGRVPMLNVSLAEAMCQTLQLTLPNLRADEVNPTTGTNQLSAAMKVLMRADQPLQVVDYLLAHCAQAEADELESLLARSKSAWTVGERSGHAGLTRRVPLGVQMGSDAVMARSGSAGVRLARAWEELYGLHPNPSEAYRLAILAVEDAAVPVVSPRNAKATLGTVLKQLEDQRDWTLPMARQHPDAGSGAVLVSMLRMLWHGQHDRHGGQPSAPGDVSQAEAQVAVLLGVTLVDWFSAELATRGPAE